MAEMIICAYGFFYTFIYAAIYVISRHIYRIQKQKLKLYRKQFHMDKKKARYQRRQVKIMIQGLPVLACMVHSFYNICSLDQLWDLFQCLRLPNHERLTKGILLSFYMNSVLYVGPIYQEMWNGNLRRKLAKLNVNKFRWDYFTKIVITPLIDEIIFRGLINNSINHEFQNNIFFIFYSTILYALAKAISLKTKYYDASFKQLLYEVLNAIMLGAYLSFVLVKTQTLATVVINHGYMNFMGTPNFGDLLNGDIDYMKQSMIFTQQETIKFYILGVTAFIILCITVL